MRNNRRHNTNQPLPSISLTTKENSLSKYILPNIASKPAKRQSSFNLHDTVLKKKYLQSHKVTQVNALGNQSQNIRIRHTKKSMSMVKEMEKGKNQLSLYLRDKIKKNQKTENSTYYQADLRNIFFDKNKDYEQRIEYHHALVSIHVAKKHYKKRKQNKPLREKVKRVHSHLDKPRQRKILLLFDLDETLIHTLGQDEYNPYSDKEEVWIQNAQKQVINFFVNVRPHAREMLYMLSRSPFFSLGIFTAGEKTYAKKIMQIFQGGDIFDHFFFRDHCEKSDNKFIKNLQKLESIDISSTILIDNSPFSYMYQPNNAIPIFPFIDEKDDNQLLKLQKFLVQHVTRKFSGDVRQVLENYFKLEEYGRFSNVKDLVDDLYIDKD